MTNFNKIILWECIKLIIDDKLLQVVVGSKVPVLSYYIPSVLKIAVAKSGPILAVFCTCKFCSVA